MEKIAVPRYETVSENYPGVGCLKPFHDKKVYLALLALISLTFFSTVDIIKVTICITY